MIKTCSLPNLSPLTAPRQGPKSFCCLTSVSLCMCILWHLEIYDAQSSQTS